MIVLLLPGNNKLNLDSDYKSPRYMWMQYLAILILRDT